jgi:hypothetical protein
VRKVVSTAELVTRLSSEYRKTRVRLAGDRVKGSPDCGPANDFLDITTVEKKPMIALDRWQEYTKSRDDDLLWDLLDPDAVFESFRSHAPMAQ